MGCETTAFSPHGLISSLGQGDLSHHRCADGSKGPSKWRATDLRFKKRINGRQGLRPDETPWWELQHFDPVGFNIFTVITLQSSSNLSQTDREHTKWVVKPLYLCRVLILQAEWTLPMVASHRQVLTQLSHKPYAHWKRLSTHVWAIVHMRSPQWFTLEIQHGRQQEENTATFLFLYRHWENH